MINGQFQYIDYESSYQSDARGYRKIKPTKYSTYLKVGRVANSIDVNWNLYETIIETI